MKLLSFHHSNKSFAFCCIFAFIPAVCKLSRVQAAELAFHALPFRDIRILQDVPSATKAALSFGGDWALGKVVPEAKSGTMQGRKDKVVSNKGRIVKNVGEPFAAFAFGVVRSRAIFEETLQPETDYVWEIALSSLGFSNNSEDEQRYTPFNRDGGTVIFRYNEKAEGAAKFNPVYLIPDEWAPFVVPAFKWQQANKTLLDETKVVANVKQLNALLGDKNPFNAIAAARVLAPQRGLDVPFISSTLSSSTGYTQAIFTYLAFNSAHPIRQAAIDNALGKVIDQATTSTTLKWMSLGITTAQNDNAQSYFALKNRVKALLLRVDKRQKALNTKLLADEYVNELLVGAQIRLEPIR